MAFVYDTVTIDGDSYDVYEDVTAADAYLKADPKRQADWDALTDDEKGRALVATTRIHDRLPLNGAKTDDDNTYRMPRTGLTGPDGEEVDSATLPDDWEASNIILAADIAQDTDLVADQSTGDNNKRLKAGSVEIERFRPEAGRAIPDENWDLIKHYLSSNASITAPTIGGTSTEPVFDNVDEFGRNRGWA